MNPFRTLPEPAADAPPLVYYILPPEQDAEAPIGPGDLEIEFEFEADSDADDE
ncbi:MULTISPECIES: hypothetical protein [Sphingomonas]|uniref:Uncharacterized protein n=1 Tax=Sphingomonas kyeonggiensis TaxID=1268553 RepID=A0A7W7K401_9SPHN|nr:MULTISPECIES: hypothetical protein [Sphingomonas]MBB4840637.1 hypothetical protein [Sphingomonas kyeonggiensis]WHU00942.1 hypothetical protein O3305_11990 [Sphingomonas sp. NIBR02145]